jgi:regulator of replication initiation timing
MTLVPPLSQEQIIHNHMIRLTSENQQLRREIAELKEKLNLDLAAERKMYWKQVFEHLKSSKPEAFSTV